MADFELHYEVPALGLRPICTFYTYGDGRGYDEEAAQWNESFRGVDRIIGKCKGPATWREACFLKPEFLLWCINKYQGKIIRLAWIDADARLVDSAQLESALGTRSDVVVRRRINENGEPEILGGTIIINLDRYNLVTKFLGAWISALSATREARSDQSVLGAVLDQQEVAGLEVGYLAPQMCWIFDSDAKRYPRIDKAREPFNAHKGPAIIHYQASRTRKGGLQQRELFQ